MKIQLSGPVTGRPERNRPAFIEAEKHLQLLAMQVFNPLREMKDSTKPWHWYVSKTISRILSGEVEVLVVLPGWQDSLGSLHEIQIALLNRVQVQEYESILQIEAGNANARSFQVRDFLKLLAARWKPLTDEESRADKIALPKGWTSGGFV